MQSECLRAKFGLEVDFIKLILLFGDACGDPENQANDDFHHHDSVFWQMEPPRLFLHTILTTTTTMMMMGLLGCFLFSFALVSFQMPRVWRDFEFVRRFVGFIHRVFVLSSSFLFSVHDLRQRFAVGFRFACRLRERGDIEKPEFLSEKVGSQCGWCFNVLSCAC